MNDHDIKRLRSELAMLRARYDHGAVSPEVYVVIRGIELELAWLEHGAATRVFINRPFGDVG
jgi:hypothetical protein